MKIEDMTITDLTVELDKRLVEKWDEYLKLNEELEPFRGKEIGNNIETINSLVLNMQCIFNDLYPAIYFIGNRYQFGVNMTNSYTAFIEGLEKSGFTEEPLPPKPEKSKIIS
jgi:hypothetical protein